jgi:hypothetical protein
MMGNRGCTVAPLPTLIFSDVKYMAVWGISAPPALYVDYTFWGPAGSSDQKISEKNIPAMCKEQQRLKG